MKSLKDVVATLKPGMTRREKRMAVVRKLQKEGYGNTEIMTIIGLGKDIYHNISRDIRVEDNIRKIANEPAIKRLREELA